MSIFHKSMLAGAVEVARVEKDNPFPILLEPTGEVVTINQWAIYAAQPAVDKRAGSLFKDSPLAGTRAISCDQLTELVRTIPADKQIREKLFEYVSIVDDEEKDKLLVTINDGKSKVIKKIRYMKAALILTDWKNRFRAIKLGNHLGDFVFNRTRLSAVVAAIEAACRYDAEFAYIEQRPFEGGYLWRSINEMTGQAVDILWKLPIATNITMTNWENNLLNKTQRQMVRR